MNTVYILLGSNLGNRQELLQQACAELESEVGTIIRKSSLYESEPWGFESENIFLNQVLCLQTALSATKILEKTLAVESRMGRERHNTTETYESRLIDIDMLFFNSEIINLQNLIVPHPRLHLRRFTLMPLQEIASGFVHPVFGKTMQELLNQCEDESGVSKLEFS